MSEERLENNVFAKSEVAGCSQPSEAGPAIKSRTENLASERGRPTSGPTSLELIPETRRPASSRAEIHPPRRRVADPAVYRDYRKICDELMAELKRADEYLADGMMSDMGMEVVVEVEQLLDKLYRCRWGEKECLKRVVVAISSQINNVRWTEAHIEFLKDIVLLLRNSYLVDDSLVRECYRLIRAHGLEAFRGTIAETEVRKKYRIVEVE